MVSPDQGQNLERLLLPKRTILSSASVGIGARDITCSVNDHIYIVSHEHFSSEIFYQMFNFVECHNSNDIL